ncbi:MAG TPA: metallopeptidase family protein [Phycisphaerales bacterium]|nr:metallopeptidase family protein [Phycisphaerales bacterium]HMP37453.1 metallopeptidase family protein [Phycisphaerales bacterium]
MTPRERERFDRLLEEILAAIPPALHELLEEAPVLVDDRPSRALLRELGIDAEQETLCGLHSGTPLTERSFQQGFDMPETIHLFREGIIEQAGGWDERFDEEGAPMGGEAAVREEIRITLLHEIGHHFGLDEDDLARLGYE